ncbi:MAG: hypothetical protein ACXWD7_06650 [Solirubrobacterales bacterium]
MRRFLNPRRLWRNVRKLREVRRGGGPKRVRVVNFTEPRGIIAPTSDVELEVEAKDGTVTDIHTIIPIPWPYVWAWRIGRKLKLPLVSQLDPRKLNNLALKVPGGD